ncbi:MAG: hypothetical protein M3137_02265 [Actinomycetota bacterium]|nr:hypothetical protein [Actinomycetota bacterium]
MPLAKKVTAACWCFLSACWGNEFRVTKAKETFIMADATTDRIIAQTQVAGIAQHVVGV